MKKKTSLLLSVLVIISSIFFYQELLSSIANIRSPHRAPPCEYPLEIEKFLQTPLSFIGMGSQCVAFSAKNTPYVLKLCKANRYQIPSFLEQPPLSFFLKDYVERKKRRKKEKQEADYASYIHAYSKTPKQSGIVFLHLEKTNTPGVVIQLKDPLGISHYLERNDLIFYIQKKARPLKEHLIKLLQEQKTAQIKTFFYELLAMVIENTKSGVLLKDINPKKNIGVSEEGLPVWIDPGRIIPSTLNLETALDMLSKEFTPFLDSIDKTLASHFLEAVTTLKKQKDTP